MAIYFNIILPFQKFIPELEKLMDKYSVYLYVEKWNEERKFYYELIDSKSENFSFQTDKEYRGIFFSSLLVEVKDGDLISGKKKKTNSPKLNFYDDSLFHYCIDGQGGREDEENIEALRLRRSSKTPEAEIQKFYNDLQSHFKNSADVKKGLQILNHFDSTIYYCKSDKNMLSSFEMKEVKYIEKM